MAGVALGLTLSGRDVPAWWLDRKQLRFGAIGDSITANQFTTSSAFAAQVGAVRNWNGRAWAPWAAQLSGRQFWCDIWACEGYSGYRTEQVLAAMLPATATANIGVSGNAAAIPLGVRARKPAYCFEMTGTNDLTQGVALATVVANRAAIWAALRAVGVEPIAISLLPRGDDAGRASLVPSWNAAIATAAASAGVKFIDVYSNCAASTGGGFKPGWMQVNGVADPLAIHPGNEACQQMALDIAAALAPGLPKRPKTPSVVSASTYVTAHPDGRSKSRTLTGSLGGGVFPNATGWGPRSESGATSSTTVAADALAQTGSALVVTLPAPASASELYSDRWGPGSLAVTPGKTYGLSFRLQFAAGGATDSLVIGLQGGNSAGAVLWSLQTGGGQGSAGSVSGASMPARDIYTEITIPPGITTVRPWCDAHIKLGSAGGTLKLAQLGLREVG